MSLPGHRQPTLRAPSRVGRSPPKPRSQIHVLRLEARLCGERAPGSMYPSVHGGRRKEAFVDSSPLAPC